VTPVDGEVGASKRRSRTGREIVLGEGEIRGGLKNGRYSKTLGAKNGGRGMETQPSFLEHGKACSTKKKKQFTREPTPRDRAKLSGVKSRSPHDGGVETRIPAIPGK